MGLFALTPWAAIYSAVVAASCLELKDKLKGFYRDWFDWLMTIVGGGSRAFVYYSFSVFFKIIKVQAIFFLNFLVIVVGKVRK